MGLFSRKRSIIEKNRNSNSGMNNLKRTGKRLLLVTGCMMALLMAAPMLQSEAVDNVLGVETAYASESTFSEFWFQDTDGSWKVRDNSGNIVKNAWLCDDAISANGQNVWYLLDANGNMLTQGLVQDQTGNYYSLEVNHNGFYGMLRYQSGNYDGVNLSLESSHSGAFASIKNSEAIEALKSKYGVTNVNINNSNCVYTSTFKSTTSNNNPGGGATENNILPGGGGKTLPPGFYNIPPDGTTRDTGYVS